MLTRRVLLLPILTLVPMTPLAAAVSPAEAQAHADLRAWAATDQAAGAQGRPLPVAGHWNTGPDFNRVFERLASGSQVPEWQEGWHPMHMVDQIRQGRRVMISFSDTTNATLQWYLANEPARVGPFFDRYYRPALEYARDHGLPIGFVGWNWEDQVAFNGPASGPDSAWLLRNGTATRKVDPFGPVDAWRRWGESWLVNPVMAQIQEIYPDPPLVVFLNNNEGGQLHSTEDLGDDADRFNALYPASTSLAERAQAIRSGYATRWAAMFSAARASLTKAAWQTRVRFVAYNAWSDAIMGRGDYNPYGTGSNEITFDPAPGKGYRTWVPFDGAMPEYYDNQWQGSKTDFAPWSPQTESFHFAAVQDMVFAERPNMYFSSIAWEGGKAADSFTKVNGYITGGYGPEAQHWDADRYLGFHQFGLWAMRPRDYREFRATDPRDGYNEATWQTLLSATDLVWNTPALREYWRFGRLVANTQQAVELNGHYFDTNPQWPQWLKDLPRWYLLTSTANPPASTWNRDHTQADSTRLRVMAIALSLGAAPSRRWLIYAHAPLGAVAGSTVQLPGFGPVALDYVSRRGSFFEVQEAGGAIQALVRGGPGEIHVTTGKRRLSVGEEVTVSATVAHPASQPFTHYEWSINGGTAATRTVLTEGRYTFGDAGERLITVAGVTAGGERVLGQTMVFVGPGPDDHLAYSLSFDHALAAGGPWTGNGRDLVRYRFLPNGVDQPPLQVPMHGGALVNDPERGGVFQLSAPGDGVTLPADGRTTLNPGGPSNLSIGFWFKADALSGTQGLFAQGYGHDDGGGGYSIYLRNGRLYAGSWSITGRPAAGGSVAVEDGRWEGHWLTTESERIVAGKWHHVQLILRDATDRIEPDKLSLYIDDRFIASGPGVRVKRHWTHPRLGSLGSARLHDGVVNDAFPFRGRLDDFAYATAAPQPVDPSLLAVAINAGGSAVVGASGIGYTADRAFSGGGVRTVSVTAPVRGGEDADVYRSARQGGSFAYALPLETGTYNVVLKFVELDHLANGQRRFSVRAEGVTALADLDLHAAAGALAGYDATFPVIVSDGTLDLQFEAGVGEATISGIQVWRTASGGSGSPSSLFPAATSPAASDDDGDYELGVRMTALEAGSMTAVRYFRTPGEGGGHTARIWSDSGTLLASAVFANETASGWQQAELSPPVAMTAGQAVVVSVNDNAGGGYAFQSDFYTASRTRGALRTGANAGVYADAPGTFPTLSFQGGCYFRDVVFVTDGTNRAPAFSKPAVASPASLSLP